MTSTPGPGTLLSYLAAALVWGASFLLMKVALVELGPGQVAVGRAVTGGLTLALLMAVTRRRWPRERWLWAHMTVVAVLSCLGPFLLFAWSGQYLPSGISAVLNATTPLWTAVMTAAAVRAVRLRSLQVGGLLVGVLGVAVVMGAWRVAGDLGSTLPAQLAVLGATACYGAGFTWMRRFVVGRHDHDPLTVTALQVGLAGLLALVVGPVAARGPLPGSLPVVAAMVALGCLGTGLAYVWTMRVLVDWGPVPASTVTYVIPVVGVSLGVLVLGERLSWNEPVGALVVLVGVVLAQGLLPRRARPGGARRGPSVAPPTVDP